MLLALGRLAAHYPRLTVAGWVIAAALLVASSAMFGRAFDDDYGVPGSDSQRAGQLLERSGAAEAGLTAQVVLSPRAAGTFGESASATRAAGEVRDRLRALPNVVAVSDLREGMSADGTVVSLRVQYPVVGRLGAADLDRLKGAVSAARTEDPGRLLRIEANGDLFFAFEQPESGAGEVAGIAIAAVILLVAFGSLVAAGLPIAIALFGLVLTMAALPLVGHLFQIPSWAPAMAAMVGLGVGIDYALLSVSRHREHLARGMPVAESVVLTVATAGRAVVFAGGIVMVAILGLAVAGLPFVTAGGIAISVAALVMVSASVTLLPALLALAGTRVDRFALPRARRARDARGAARSERWARHVTRHAAVYLVVAALGMVALAAPVLSLRLGNPDDGTLPGSRTERRAYDLAAAGFGAGVNGPLVIALDAAGDGGAAGRLRTAVAADPGIASVTPPRAHGSTVASMTAIPVSSPQDPATRDTLRRLRERVIPAALAGSPARAHVGGQTAVFADMSERVADRLPAFIAAVVALSLVLLVFVFRSVLVPVKAAVLNLLSIGASYGVIVMVFQWGWGASLIGVHDEVPVVSFIPMFMFAIVFGLSMDYEVFMLSRVREHYLATGDNDESVVRGLAGTARTITSSAAIMVAVFLGFVAGSDPSTKMFGLGLAVAVLLDATVVRLILAPAAMALMGRANWWLPPWLERMLPGGQGAPLPSRAPAVVETEPTSG
jgi:RND superfamily putative drug exporter